MFCKQFPNPEMIIENAAAAGVCCILTGTDRRENGQIDAFVRTHPVFGTAGIHPHNADSARKEDFEQIERMLMEMNGFWQWESVGLTLIGCFLQRRIRFDVWKSILFWQSVLINRCSFMKERQQRSLSGDLRNIRISVKSRWFTVLLGIKERWNSTCRWVFLLGLRDGSAMREEERN